MLGHALSCSVVSSPQTVRDWLKAFIERTGADELMVMAPIFDHAARMRSFEILAEAWHDLAVQKAAEQPILKPVSRNRFPLSGKTA